MNSYFILWPAEWCKRLTQAGDAGPLQVIYGGPHSSVPPLGKVAVGDVVYPVSIKNGQVFILARMQVEKTTKAETYLTEQQIDKHDGELWDTSAPKLLKQRPELGHRVPRSCVDNAALGQGTLFRFDFKVPEDILAQLQFGPKAGTEKELPHTKTGVVNLMALQGHFRRLSAESAARIADLMQLF